MSSPSNPVPPAISDYFATIGATGGQAARGAAKRRDPEHYRRMSRLGVKKRLANLQSKKQNIISPNVCNAKTEVKNNSK